MDLYFISGLGVDKRVFKKLVLPNHFPIHHIDWIPPLKKESVSSYAKRLANGIDQSRAFALIGLSFGGMIAIEMNRYIKPVKTIIISSVSTCSQLPWYIRFIGFMPLYKLIPSPFLKWSNPLYNRLFGINTIEEKKLFKEILQETDNSILKWSIHAITNWRNKIVPENLIHLHGKKDKILPVRFTNADAEIEGGGHFMVFSKATEISEILNKILLELPDAPTHRSDRSDR